MLYYLRLIWFLSPVIFLLYYTKNLLWKDKWFKKAAGRLEKNSKKRLFYLMSLFWYIGFCTLNYNQIVDLKLLKEYNIQKDIANHTIVFCVYLVSLLFIDFIFIRKINLTKLNIKGIELNMEEIDDITESHIIQKEKIDILRNVLFAEYNTICMIHEHLGKLECIDEETIYIDLLRIYTNLRRCVSIECHYYADMERLKIDSNMSDEEFSAIQHTMELNNVCLIIEEKVTTIYAKIFTSFVFDDLIVRITGNLYEEEHKVIQNIVSAFDKQLTIYSCM